MIKEQYVRFPRRLLESPVLRVLTANERRALDRILVEHQSKAGYVNDGLPVTHRDFVHAGVHSRHVVRALRVLKELGIVECVRNMGRSRNGRTPNLWRPTFLPRTPTADDATHDYAKFSLDEATAIANTCRAHDRRVRAPSRRKGSAQA